MGLARLLNSRWMRRPAESYKGLSNGCAPGTHQAAVRLIGKHVPHRSGVLDLGASTGALLLRLRDQGWQDLHAADLDGTEFSLPNVPFTRVDLNGEFAAGFTRRFKLICLTEVIEHLDSPRHFLEQAHGLLAEDGYLALSLPNIAYWEGRIKFLLTGELWGFGENTYRTLRHVSPMTVDMMRLTMQELGFSVIESTTAAGFASSLRWVIFSPLWLPIRIVGGRRVFGESAVFLAKKTQRDGDLSVPTLYRAAWEKSGAAESSVVAGGVGRV